MWPIAIAIAAAAGGATAGCHPTGTAVLDPLYTAATAAVVTLAASRANRVTLLVLAVVGVAMSRHWLLLPALAALALAFGATLPRRAYPLLGALSGAVAVQVMLRWPARGFQGLTAAVAVAAVTPCLLSAFGRLSRRHRRRTMLGAGGLLTLAVVLSVPAVIEALAARSDINAGIQATEGALSGLTSGARTSDTAQLQQAAADFHQANIHTGSWVTLGARLVPIASQQQHALATATSTAGNVTAVAARQAATVNLGDLSYADGGIDPASISALDGPLATVDTTLATSDNALRGLQRGWLVSPIRSRLDLLQTQITAAARQANLAYQVVRAAPALLGADGPRHYLVAFLTPSENRGLGGLIGAYGELTVDHGRITLSRSGSISQLNAGVANGARHITGPPSYLARYGGFDPQDNFQDLGYAPDLPTVSQVISQMYPQSGGDHIDGVLTLDPVALADLLNLTGPLDVPGLGRLTPANAAEELLQGQYDNLPPGTAQGARHDYLQDALRLAFTKLSSGTLPDPQALAQTLNPVVRQGHLQFWSLHPSDQAALRLLGVDGSFPAAGRGDLLAVTTQNAANNKIDAYLQRTINDRVRFDPSTGATTSTVTITLHNAAPSGGLPPIVLGSYPGSGLAPGTNRTWLSVYTPFALVAARQGAAPVDVTAVPEFGVETYSTYVNVPPGGTVVITLDLAGRTQPGAVYTVTLHQQPMVRPDHDTVTVVPTGGWRAAAAPVWTPGLDATQGRSFAFRR